MTGFGEARRATDALQVQVEIRSVNSRYLKLNLRITEPYQSLEPLIESLVRKRLARGTIAVSVRIQREHLPDEYQLNVVALESYRRQVDELELKWHAVESVPLAQLLLLPGAVKDQDQASTDVKADWPLIREALDEAIGQLCDMRAAEGKAMARDLKANARQIVTHLDQIEQRAPQVVESYRDRLYERVQKLLASSGVELDPADLIREVSIFAERSDIAEETVRLRSHVDQFEKTLQSPESSGRRLDFLTQEMVREANTIGSKANDVEISRHVVEIKALIERIREMVQNVE